MSDFEISTIKQDDIEIYVELIEKMYKLVPNRRSHNDEWKPEARNFLKASIVDEKVRSVVVRSTDGTIVGCGAGMVFRDIPKHYVDRDKIGYVRYMYVEDQYRGNGLGSMIMKDLLEWFKINDVSTIQLHSSPKAMAIYEKFGFHESSNVNMWLTTEIKDS